jgi:hypothetical protein
MASMEIIASSGESRAAKMVREIFESGRPLTYIRSSEEQRVGRVLREVGGAIWTWSMTEGMRRDGQAAEAGTETARGALDFIIAHQGAAIFQLKDFHEPLRESAEIRRRLRDVHDSLMDQRKFVVISSAVRFIPEEVERSILFLELRPPDLVELADFLREETGEANEELLYQVARALQGLTLDEAKYALRRALAVSPRLGPESIPAVLQEKRLCGVYPERDQAG